MPVTMEAFVALVEEIAPRGLAFEWDNTGLLLRCGDSVSKALICLDATRSVADEAAASGCDMILSHHPLLFAPVKSLDHAQANAGVLMQLVKNGISLYAAHTSFDVAPGGVNDALSGLLGLDDVQTVGEESILRVGSLPQPCGKAAFIARVKALLGIERLLVTRGFEGEITRVAVVGGSGGEYVAEAKKQGAQALLTGEAKHHHRIEAAQAGILMVEAGHFNTERCFCEAIFGRLQSCANALQLQLSFKIAECMQAPEEIL